MKKRDKPTNILLLPHPMAWAFRPWAPQAFTKAFFVAALFCLGLHGGAFSQPPIHKLSDSVVDAEGLTVNGIWGANINGKTYQRSAHVSHKGWQYVAYYDKNRNVCVARRRHQTSTWEILRLTDYATATNDGHNTISIGICPQDGTIHLSFDHHTSILRYRFSQKNVANDPENIVWSASLFSTVRDKLGTQLVSALTYPQFLQTPDGGLQFLMRQGTSGNGDKMLYRYIPATSNWALVRMVDSRNGNFTDIWGTVSKRNSYPNDFEYDTTGRLHTTWCWRESGWAVNHDIMYAYSDDQGNTWRNNGGTAVAMPMRVDTPGLVAVPISTRYGLLNDQAQVVDSKGRVHVVMSHSQLENDNTTTVTYIGWASAGGPRYFHYWRSNSGTWTKFMLPWPSGNRPKMLADRDDNLNLIYQSGFRLEIAHATAAAQWADWAVIYSEYGPFFNEMLADTVRWKQDGVLSVFTQQLPASAGTPSPIRILEFRFGAPSAATHWEFYGRISPSQ